MFLLFSLVLLFPTITYSDTSSMIVTYGKPINYTTYSSYPAKSWDDCVIQCYKLASCVLTHSSAEPINCQLYNANEIFEVKKLEASDALLVAFKVANSQDSCPIGDNAPTFGDVTNHGAVSTNVANYTYDINYSNDGSWKFVYNVIPICSEGWTTFIRPTTNWCIQVFGNATITYTQSQSLSYCESIESTLTGLETTQERDFVANTGIALLGPDYPEFSGFWVSGVRKPECYADGWTEIPDCVGTSLKQFTYTDNYLTNYDGYTWDYEQPDRNTNGEWQNCIQIWIRNEEKFPNFNYSLYANGNSDDALCDVVDFQDYHLRGFACGKLPQLPNGTG